MTCNLVQNNNTQQSIGFLWRLGDHHDQAHDQGHDQGHNHDQGHDHDLNHGFDHDEDEDETGVGNLTK